MYFLRQARELYLLNPDKQLSPSFGDIEGTRDPTVVLNGVLPSIEHALGIVEWPGMSAIDTEYELHFRRREASVHHG